MVPLNSRSYDRVSSDQGLSVRWRAVRRVETTVELANRLVSVTTVSRVGLAMYAYATDSSGSAQRDMLIQPRLNKISESRSVAMEECLSKTVLF